MDSFQDGKPVMAPIEGQSVRIEQLLVALCSPEFIAVLSDAIVSRIKNHCLVQTQIEL